MCRLVFQYCSIFWKIFPLVVYRSWQLWRCDSNILNLRKVVHIEVGFQLSTNLVSIFPSKLGISRFICPFKGLTLSKAILVGSLVEVDPKESGARISLKWSYISSLYRAKAHSISVSISLNAFLFSPLLAILGLEFRAKRYMEVEGKGRLNKWVLEHVKMGIFYANYASSAMKNLSDTLWCPAMIQLIRMFPEEHRVDNQINWINKV